MYTHPYSDPRHTGNNPTDNSGDKKFKYILIIGKKHIILFILVMFLLFGLIFISGMGAGYSIGNNNSTGTEVITADQSLDNYNNFDTSALSSSASNSFADNSEFVSKKITLGDDFLENDVMKVNSQDNSADVQSLESIRSKKKAQSIKKSPAVKKPQRTVNSKKNIKKVKKSSRTSKSAAKNRTRGAKRYIDKPLPGVTYYYIQVIATINVDRAKEIYDQLKVRNYPVKVKKSNKDDQYLYAIRVGLYTDKNQARKHLRLIRKGGGYTKAFMKSYRVDDPIRQVSSTPVQTPLPKVEPEKPTPVSEDMIIENSLTPPEQFPAPLPSTDSTDLTDYSTIDKLPPIPELKDGKFIINNTIINPNELLESSSSPPPSLEQ